MKEIWPVCQQRWKVIELCQEGSACSLLPKLTEGLIIRAPSGPKQPIASILQKAGRRCSPSSVQNLPFLSLLLDRAYVERARYIGAEAWNIVIRATMCQLHTSSHLCLTMTLPPPPIIDDELGAQRGRTICPESRFVNGGARTWTHVGLISKSRLLESPAGREVSILEQGSAVVRPCCYMSWWLWPQRLSPPAFFLQGLCGERWSVSNVEQLPQPQPEVLRLLAVLWAAEAHTHHSS